jgi:branched-subunit amino acid aminotransferase/4-amino-4-deoxychorismate lyase
MAVATGQMGVQEKLEAAVTADGFDLIETMRFEALDGFVELERHLARMKASAQTLGFIFNRHDCRNDLQAATFRLTHDARIRLMLSKSGAVAIEVRAMPVKPDDRSTSRSLPCRSSPTTSGCTTRPATADSSTRHAAPPAPSKCCSCARTAG